MRDAFQEFFGWKHAKAAAVCLGLVWVFAAMKVLEFFRPGHPLFMFIIIVPVVAWVSVTAALHERYRSHSD